MIDLAALEARKKELEQQKEIAEVNFHRVSGALALVEELLKLARETSPTP